MMDLDKLEQQLAGLPLFVYFFMDPRELEFTARVRWVCENECPRFGRTWACPPGVGTVESCRCKCLNYENCLVIGTITEVADIADIGQALATRGPHEELTNEVREFFREQGIEPYILSTESCALCQRCAYLDGKPCRFPEKMHPCLESHGINLIPTLESQGLEFQQGGNLVTWYSLLFY
jgi:predicted metal-binding protein